jgi:anthranilate phosphoribosyltransferase
MAAFVVAGAGCTVAKHGNRAVSGSCGSADVLQALGIDIELEPERMRGCINEAGIGFLYAPLYHPAMKHVAAARRAMGIPTFFNLIGPLANPAFVSRQMIGVCGRAVAATIAETLLKLGARSAWVVSGDDGTDEVSLGAETTFIRIAGDGAAAPATLSPGMFPGLSQVSAGQIAGGSAETNASILLEVLRGAKSPYRDVVIANSAVALVAAGKSETLADAVGASTESIDSGRGMAALRKFRDATQ